MAQNGFSSVSITGLIELEGIDIDSACAILTRRWAPSELECFLSGVRVASDLNARVHRANSIAHKLALVSVSSDPTSAFRAPLWGADRGPLYTVCAAEAFGCLPSAH